MQGVTMEAWGWRRGPGGARGYPDGGRDWPWGCNQQGAARLLVRVKAAGATLVGEEEKATGRRKKKIERNVFCAISGIV